MLSTVSRSCLLMLRDCLLLCLFGQGFAAIKVTALGNPQLLERMSAALVEIRSLFREADTDGEQQQQQQQRDGGELAHSSWFLGVVT